MQREYRIREFNMSNVRKGSVCIFIGKRGSGKSFCVKDLLYYLKDIPVPRIISATEEANAFYSGFAPPAFISYKYSEETVSKFFNRQKLLKQQQRGVESGALLIMDDLMYNASEWTKSETIRAIFCNGRHYDITFVLTLQFSLGIPPDLRKNTDFVFLFREGVNKELRKLHDHWAGIIPQFKIFKEMMEKFTENYGCMVIDLSSRSSNLEDQVFWYKAVDNGPFRIGSREMWSWSENFLSQQQSNKNNKIYKNIRIV